MFVFAVGFCASSALGGGVQAVTAAEAVRVQVSQLRVASWRPDAGDGALCENCQSEIGCRPQSVVGIVVLAAYCGLWVGFYRASGNLDNGNEYAMSKSGKLLVQCVRRLTPFDVVCNWRM